MERTVQSMSSSSVRSGMVAVRKDYAAPTDVRSLSLASSFV
jgi:hypothetical protein